MREPLERIPGLDPKNIKYSLSIYRLRLELYCYRLTPFIPMIGVMLRAVDTCDRSPVNFYLRFAQRQIQH